MHGQIHETGPRAIPLAATRALARAWDRVIVLANRAPFSHTRRENGAMRLQRTASGLVTALEPLVEACAGTWVALGPPDAARGEGREITPVSPDDCSYRLRHVALTDDERRGYYYGFANEGLWPLCHRVPVRPVFRAGDFEMYRRANARFAAAVAAEAVHGNSLVLVQDYHFALAPRALRGHLPNSTVVAFWHIPWPQARVFKKCPWSRVLLDGLLGSDIIGFQTPVDCANFLDTVRSALPADVSRDEGVVSYRGHITRVRAYPVGVEWDNAHVRSLPAAEACRGAVCCDLHLPGDVRLGIGIDRLDYTKGLNEKFLAIERLLEHHPQLRGRFVFVQVAEPSRECLTAYRAVRAQITTTSQRVNARFGSDSYRPIVLLDAHHDPADVYRLYRAADVCHVDSLHDGMNLVAKEFVCARADEGGVLVLSRFAGAAQQLQAALIVNPYVIEESAGALATALAMPATEQRDRMRHLRRIVERFDTHWWARQMLRDALPTRAIRDRLAARADAERLSA